MVVIRVFLVLKWEATDTYFLMFAPYVLLWTEAFSGLSVLFLFSLVRANHPHMSIAQVPKRCHLSNFSAHILLFLRVGKIMWFPLLQLTLAIEDWSKTTTITRHSVPLVLLSYTKSFLDFLAFGAFIYMRQFRISQEKHLH